MSVACPNGHQSETTDYCDQCGALIEGAAPNPSVSSSIGAASTASAAPSATTLPGGPTPPRLSNPLSNPLADPLADPLGDPAGAGEQRCPLCQAPRIGDDRFCEGCGYDFTHPAPLPGQPTTILAAAPDSTSTPGWDATAIADREYYDRVAPEGVTFPQVCPPRTYLLAGDQIRIGRTSNSRGIQPEVDLSGAPEDSAISHLHCILIEQPDGSYSLVDPGSTNGTTVNDDPTPLMANVAVALADGDRIHLGAWTTITLHARRPIETPTATP